MFFFSGEFDFTLQIREKHAENFPDVFTIKDIPVEWSHGQLKKAVLVDKFGKRVVVDACESKVIDFDINHQYACDSLTNLKVTLRYAPEYSSQTNIVTLSDREHDVGVTLDFLKNPDYPFIDFQVSAMLTLDSAVPCRASSDNDNCQNGEDCMCPGVLRRGRVQLFCQVMVSDELPDLLATLSPCELTPYQKKYLEGRNADFMIDLYHDDVFTNSTYFVKIDRMSERDQREKWKMKRKRGSRAPRSGYPLGSRAPRRELAALLLCHNQKYKSDSVVRKTSLYTICSILKQHISNVRSSMDRWWISAYTKLSGIEFNDMDYDENLAREFIDLVNEKQRPVHCDFFSDGIFSDGGYAYRVCMSRFCTHHGYFKCSDWSDNNFFFSSGRFNRDVVSRCIPLLKMF